MVSLDLSDGCDGFVVPADTRVDAIGEAFEGSIDLVSPGHLPGSELTNDWMA